MASNSKAKQSQAKRSLVSYRRPDQRPLALFWLHRTCSATPSWTKIWFGNMSHPCKALITCSVSSVKDVKKHEDIGDCSFGMNSWKATNPLNCFLCDNLACNYLVNVVSHLWQNVLIIFSEVQHACTISWHFVLASMLNSFVLRSWSVIHTLVLQRSILCCFSSAHCDLILVLATKHSRRQCTLAAGFSIQIYSVWLLPALVEMLLHIHFQCNLLLLASTCILSNISVLNGVCSFQSPGM